MLFACYILYKKFFNRISFISIATIISVFAGYVLSRSLIDSTDTLEDIPMFRNLSIFGCAGFLTGVLQYEILNKWVNKKK